MNFVSRFEEDKIIFVWEDGKKYTYKPKVGKICYLAESTTSTLSTDGKEGEAEAGIHLGFAKAKAKGKIFGSQQRVKNTASVKRPKCDKLDEFMETTDEDTFEFFEDYVEENRIDKN